MKRLTLYTNAFNLVVTVSIDTHDRIAMQLAGSDPIVISDEESNDGFVYWINPANIAAVLVADVNE